MSFHVLPPILNFSGWQHSGWQRSCLAFLKSAPVVLFALQVSSAADPLDSSSAWESAASSVAAALEAEAEGDFLSRQRLLAEAEQQVEFPPAKWQQGNLRSADGSWQDIATCIAEAQEDPKLAEYERRRSGLADSMANHYSIATWCAEQGLIDQCRSHLNRVLAFDTDNVRARQALGYRPVGGEWIGPAELANLAQRTAQTTKSFEAFGKQMRSIAQRMSSSDASVCSFAAGELREIVDPLAVPAAEAILVPSSVVPPEAMIDWFDRVDTQESSQVLARFGLFHPQPSVRQYAAQKLLQRPLHDFVPDLMKMLSSPVSSMIVPLLDGSGAVVGYRQAFAQEKYDKKDILFLSRAAQQVSGRFDAQEDLTQMPEGQVLAAELNSSIQASVRNLYETEVAMRNAAVQRENQQLAQRNSRISELVSAVAQKEFSGDPTEMWRWWDRYNETKYQDYKPERYRRSSLVDNFPAYVEAAPTQPMRGAGECFVAGTQVVTRRGLRAIEQLVAGDLVLSRNVTTGELGWKPVLRATVRPPEATCRVTLGEEEFQCTKAHLFWVSGDGWKKASEIRPGDVLHAAEEPSVVTRVIAAAELPTYNLEVADNATYFVGKAMVLTHDVTPRRPNRQDVPGQQLVAFHLAKAKPVAP